MEDIEPCVTPLIRTLDEQQFENRFSRTARTGSFWSLGDCTWNAFVNCFVATGVCAARLPEARFFTAVRWVYRYTPIP